MLPQLLWVLGPRWAKTPEIAFSCFFRGVLPGNPVQTRNSSVPAPRWFQSVSVTDTYDTPRLFHSFLSARQPSRDGSVARHRWVLPPVSVWRVLKVKGFHKTVFFSKRFFPQTKHVNPPPERISTSAWSFEEQGSSNPGSPQRRSRWSLHVDWRHLRISFASIDRFRCHLVAISPVGGSRVPVSGRFDSWEWRPRSRRKQMQMTDATHHVHEDEDLRSILDRS